MSVVAVLAAHTGLMHDLDLPPFPAELYGAAIAALATAVTSVVGWLFARAERTSDRRVESLEAITKSLSDRVAVLERSREKAEVARDLAEEEAHHLRVRAFKLEEYAAELIRWGLSLIRMIAPEARPPAPPSPPPGFEDMSDLCGGGVAAGSFPVDTTSSHVPGDAPPSKGDSGP